MNELCMRSVATVHEGKLEDFKHLVDELLSTVRNDDAETLHFATGVRA